MLLFASCYLARVVTWQPTGNPEDALRGRVELDDPSFSAPIRAALFENGEEGRSSHEPLAFIWKRAMDAAPEARDPICGMLVTVATAIHRSERAGETVYFCCRGCQETFDRAAGG